MSVAEQIQRIQGASADIKAAIESYGVTVNPTDTYAEKIGQISGGEWLPSAETVLATFARRQSGGDGPATIEKIYGRSIVWAQLVKNGDFVSGTADWQGNNATISAADGVLTWTATNTLTYANLRQASTGFVNGHKYFVSFNIKGTQANKLDFALGNATGGGTSGSFDYGTDWTAIRAIISPLTATDFSLYIRPNAMGISGAVAYFKGQIVIIDLTASYEAGKEPSTVTEFLALYPEALTAPYDAGSLLTVKVEKMLTQGVNLWDEQWEQGNIDATTGENTANLTTIRATNYTLVLPNTQFYIMADNYAGLVRMRFYDANKAYIGYDGQVISSGIFTTPNDCYYMRIVLYSTTTYNNDICINFSDASINGQYFPYRSSDVGLPILKYFPNGLRGVDDSYDEITPRKATQRRSVVDLGDLTYGMTSGAFYATVSGRALGKLSLKCPLFTAVNTTVSNLADGQMMGASDSARVYFKNSAYADAADFKAAMSGVPLDYELATPVTTSIDEDMTYLPQLGGTEEVHPISAPFTADIRYAKKI